MSGSASFADAAANLGHSLARLAHTTAECVRTGVQQVEAAVRAERRRRVWMLVCTCLTLICLAIGALFAGVAIVIAFRETHPVLAAALVATGFFALAATAGWTLWWQSTRSPQSTPDWIARALALLAEYRR